MTAGQVHEYEASVRRVLLNIQSATDLTEAAALYEQAKRVVANALTLPEVDRDADAKRGLLALALYVHCTYRTKEADTKGEKRLLCAR